MLSVLVSASGVRLETGRFCHKEKDEFSGLKIFYFGGKILDPRGGRFFAGFGESR
jgi:hypothetical protein